MLLGPVSVSFPATTSRRFRLAFSNVTARGKSIALAEINLSGAARLESYVEKRLKDLALRTCISNF